MAAFYAPAVCRALLAQLARVAVASGAPAAAGLEPRVRDRAAREHRVAQVVEPPHDERLLAGRRDHRLVALHAAQLVRRHADDLAHRARHLERRGAEAL